MAYAFAGFLFLLIAAVLVLQIPPVQNAIVGRLLRNFSNVSGFTTRIESFSLLWFDRLELQGVTITDPGGNAMIDARYININFDITELLNQHDINIDGVILDSATVFLTKIEENDTARDLNINIFINELSKMVKRESAEPKSSQVNIGEAVLNQCQFVYVDQYRDTIAHGFDYNHFSLDIDEAQLRNFLAIGDTTQFDVITLLAKDRKTDFEIHQLSTFFRVSNASMEFNNLDLKAGKSHISDTVMFTYNHRFDLQDFVNRVTIHAHLDSAVVDPVDLALFAPGTETINKPIALSGEFNGRIKKFKVDQMQASIGNTRLLGSLDMDGLPELSETFIILNLSNSKLDFSDFNFLLNQNTLARLRPVGDLFLNGQFLGYPSDFVANGNLVSDLGRIKSDINFKVNDEDFDLSTYKGRLTMIDFDLGRYLQDTVGFQQVSLDGDIRGSGLSKSTADFTLNGKINSLGIKGYDYSNITTNAHFASGFFNGVISVNDPNLEFSAEGSVDLRNKKNLIKIRANLDTANLDKLNLSGKKIVVSTALDIDISGLELDSLVGTANFNDFMINYEDQLMELKNIQLNAQKEGANRVVDLTTTLLDAHIHGNYVFSALTADIKEVINEISLNIKNNKEEIEQYYREKTRKPESYAASFELNIKDIEPISKLLAMDLSVTPNTTIEGSFTSGYTTIFHAYTFIDSLSYKNNLLLKTEAELTTSKIADSTSVLAMAFINSEKQVIGSGLKTEQLIAEGIWNKSHIDFSIDCDQQKQNNYIRLKGAVDFMQDSTRLKLLPSMIHLLDRNWHIDATNEIVGNNHEWYFRNLELMNRNQSIQMNGHLSDNPDKKMFFQVNDLDLAILNVITDKKFTGTLNADIQLMNYYQNPSIQNDILIDSLTINDFLIGDITGNNIWDNTEKKFNVNFFIDRQQARIVNLQGDYTPAHDDPLNLNAHFEQASVRILEPFLQDIFGSMDGNVTGAFKITGTLQDPQINGEGMVHNGQLMVLYTKTLYQFNGVIALKPEAIIFKNIELMDTYKNKGSLSGTIYHRNFYQMRVDLSADFRNFQVLNTTARDNTLFYGQGYATGNVQFLGPVANMKIISNARTEKNTRIYIPIGGSSSVEKKEFINFINLTDTTQVVEVSTKTAHDNRVDLTGLTFELNLDVTPDMYCEIIFDIKSGDIIRGRGNGDLKLQLDTKGEFNMFGSVEFSEGWYNFTLYDLINKEFEIKKGSRITWFGDPYAALLDINATYNQLASFAAIVNDPNLANSPELRRKYPVQVLLMLDGPLLSPQISFDILANDLPQSVNVANNLVRLDFLFETFKSNLDEQGLMKQVFSLIVLRKFSPPDAFFNPSGTLYNSVSELLSNQLSYWMSQVDENLEIDVDLGTMDQEAFNTFQLRLSYTFLNGRLRITRDGTFGNSGYNDQATNNRGNLASIAGDWTVDYFLTADGKFKIKMYNRTNYNQLSTSLNNQSYLTTGVSLQHVQSFNELKDLIRFARTKNRKESERKPQEQDPVQNEEAIKEEEEGG